MKKKEIKRTYPRFEIDGVTINRATIYTTQLSHTGNF